MGQRLPSTASAFATGFSFALVVCAAVAAQRVSHGSTTIAAVAHLLITLAVVAVASAARGPSLRIGAALAGGTCAIAVAHALLRSSSVAAYPWLTEAPPQIVNDAVAVFAPLAIVWASSHRPPRTVVLVATLVLVTIYRATGRLWHLDGGHFQHTVQDLVTLELGCAALGLVAFRFLVPAARC